MILPLPSSPHWAPTRIVFAIADGVNRRRQQKTPTLVSGLFTGNFRHTIAPISHMSTMRIDVRLQSPGAAPDFRPIRMESARPAATFTRRPQGKPAPPASHRWILWMLVVAVALAGVGGTIWWWK